MDKQIPRMPKHGDIDYVTKPEDHATLADRSQGVMDFMREKEEQVRRVKAAFNIVIGTKFDTVREIEEYSKDHDGLVDSLLEDASNSWQRYIEKHEETLLTIHRDVVSKWKANALWFGLIGLSIGGFLGYASRFF